MAAVRDWSDGRYTKAGCNLKFILDWAWARVVEIKVSLIQSQSQSDPKEKGEFGLWAVTKILWATHPTF